MSIENESIVRYRSHVQEVQDSLEAYSVHESLPEGFDASYSNSEVRQLATQEDETQLAKELASLHKSGLQKLVELYKLLSIFTLGGVLGVCARRGLNDLSSYRGAYISGVVWSNFTACVIMGVAVESQTLWHRVTTRYESRAKIPLYVGITTGFCGSVSSFSSLILEIFEKSCDLLPAGYNNYPNAAYGIMEFLSVCIAQLTMSIAGLQFGKHLGLSIEHTKISISISFYRFLEFLCVIAGTLAWIAVIVIAATESHGRSWSLSCVFAPLGVFARFYLSKSLNARIKDFPLGTFACNFSGTLLLLIFNLLNRGIYHDGGRIISSQISCQVLESLSDGFCGCFTTVSTFAVELSGLKLIKSYRYGSLSVISSFVALLLIMGPYNWTTGFANTVC